MSIEKMFETATRNKLRFSYKGQISVEDLWDLTASALDTIYKGLNSQLKETKEESLLQIRTPKDKELELKIEIIKHIVKVKLEEADAKIRAKQTKEQRDKILEALATKQDEALMNKTPEELQAMLKELEA